MIQLPVTNHRKFVWKRRLTRLRNRIRVNLRFISVNPKKALILFLSILLSQVLLFWYFVPRASAAWYDDAYTYRQLISFTHNAAISTPRRVTLTIDTATLITNGKMQSSCNDSRFVDLQGNVLRYQLTASCNNASTTYDVEFLSINNGTNSAYFYYGNPQAASKSDASVANVTSVSPSGGSPSIATEEKGTTPVLAWRFSEGTGTTSNDSSQYQNNGTINSASSWLTEDLCAIGKCLSFNGSSDKVSKSYVSDKELDHGTGSFSLSAWFKHTSTAPGSNHMLISRYSSGGYKIYMNSSGYLCFGIDSDATWTPTNAACSGAAQGSYADSNWHQFEAVKSGTSSITLYIDGIQVDQITSSIDIGSLSGSSPTFYVGVDSDGTSNYWAGSSDEVKVYSYAKTPAEVKMDYTNRGGFDETASSVGNQNSYKALSQGLVGYWKMDDNVSGNNQSVVDASGNGNTGTTKYGANTTGMNCTVAGKFGAGCQFDGVDDYIDAASPTSLDNLTANAMTVSAWINCNFAGGNCQAVMGKDDGGTNGWFVKIAGNVLSMTIPTSGTTAFSTYTVNSLSTAWHHVVFVYNNQTDRTIKIYVDGKEVTYATQTPATGNVNADASLNLNLGWRGWVGNEYFTGSLDDIRIYNRAFSPAEISQLYDWSPRPIGYWNMDERTGQTAYDSSGNGSSLLFGADANPGANDPVWSNGKYGGAVKFDGIDDTLKGTINAPVTNTSFTVTFWMKDLGNPSTAMIYEGGQPSAPSFEGSNGTYEFWMNNNDSLSATVSQNRWYHFSQVYDATAQTQKLYQDGVLIGTNTGISSDVINDSLYLGNRNNNGLYFKGELDDFKIYNYSRTPKQIIEDMNAGHPAGGSPLGSMLTYQKFNEGADNTCSGGTNDYCNSGNGGNTYDMANSGLVWTNNGKFGKAVTVDTNTDNASMGDVAFVDGLTGMTASLWLKPASLGTSKAILGKWTSGQTNFQITSDASTNTEIRVYISSNGGTDNGSNYCTTSGLGLSTSAFQQLTIVYDGTASTGNNIKVYRNASPITCTVTGTIPASMTSSTTSALKLGDFAAGSVALLSDYDNLKIYTYSLTADEVKIDYNRNSGMVIGAASTASDGVTADNSSAREYCIPGDTSTCNAPAGEWKLEENTGQILYDTSGNGSNGTLGANSSVATDDPKWTPGKYGSGLYMDGNDYASIPDTTSLNISSAGTIEAWFKATDITAGGAIVSQWNSTTNNLSWAIYGGTNLTILLDADGNPVATSCQYDTTNANLTSKTWYHLAFVHDGSGTPKVYINGKLQTGTVSSGTCPATLYNSSTDMEFGALEAGADPFTGSIDNVILYNYVRTPAQIAWDYNRGRPVAWYKFDECSGSTINDSSNNGYTATLTVGATGEDTSAGSCSVVDTTTAWYNGSSGKFNASLKFDQSDDYVKSTASDMFDSLTTDGTLSAWVKLKSNASTAYKQVISYGSGCGALNENEFEFALDKVDDNNVRVAVWAITGANPGCGGSNLIEAYSPSIPNPYAWHHIVYTSNSSGNKLYVDGVQQTVTYSTGNSSTSAFIGGSSAGSSYINVGRAADGIAEVFYGQIDDVRIYNYALTKQQIQLLYNNDAAMRYGY